MHFPRIAFLISVIRIVVTEPQIIHTTKIYILVTCAYNLTIILNLNFQYAYKFSAKSACIDRLLNLSLDNEENRHA